MKVLNLSLSFLLISYSLLAADIEIQSIRVGGTGCPSEVTEIVFSPDHSSASLIFQSFESHVPNSEVQRNPKAQRNIHNLNCNMFLTLKLSPNQRLDSLNISYDMRGNALLARGVTGGFKSYLMSAQGLGVEMGRSRAPELLNSKLWLNSSIDQDEDFIISSTKTILMKSACNKSQVGLVTINLQHQLGTQIISGNKNDPSEGTIMVDTSDLKGGVKFSALTSKCI